MTGKVLPMEKGGKSKKEEGKPSKRVAKCKIP